MDISTEKFSDYIIRTLATITDKSTYLISYCSPIEDLALSQKIRNLLKSYEKSFYWNKSADGMEFIGLGELVSITDNGKGRFASCEKKIKQWLDNSINNFDQFDFSIPLFMGGIKFIPESNNSLWDNFQDSNWFVPKILFVNYADNHYLIYNLLLNRESQSDKIIKEYELKLNTLVNEKNDNCHSNNLKVISLLGNSPKDKRRWIDNCKKAISKIESGSLIKIVLSRHVELNLNEEADICTLINDLKANCPECYLFGFHSGKSTFFGASPEKFLKIDSTGIEIDALAGSAPRGKSPEEDSNIEGELLFNKKNLQEHKLVVDHIEKQFSKLSKEIHKESSPKVKKLKNIQHLWTPLKIETSSKEKLFNILELLHPTPAVCGLSVQDAIREIRELEDYPRGLYSGLIGWFNNKLAGEFTVAIRAALSTGKKIYAFAGSGIVEGSDPNAEYEETSLKLNTILSLFDNENKN